MEARGLLHEMGFGSIRDWAAVQARPVDSLHLSRYVSVGVQE
jgi:hypothetical protein